MTILNSLAQSQSLLQKIKSINKEPEVNDLLISLTKELNTLQSSIEQLPPSSNASDITAPQTKSGCYLFANDKNYYCPKCYDNKQERVATTRINSKLRVCPACRNSIK